MRRDGKRLAPGHAPRLGRFPFFLLLSSGALLLRLVFLWRFPQVTEDSYVYGDLAKNWLLHGVYGLSGPRGITPSLIRLPGYPLFLCFCFFLFGYENYRAVMALQVLIDLATCFLIADLAKRTAGEGSSRVAFALSGFCVFFANYAATVLTETLAIFAAAAALDLAVIVFDRIERDRVPRRAPASLGGALALGILLRPDGGILLGSLLAYAARALRRHSIGRKLRMALFWTSIVALLPLLPWTIRNWRTFHVLEPLAPLYANAPGEYVPCGFIRWQKTWIADYVSVEDVWFHLPDSPIDPNLLPQRAFDNAEEKRRTLELIARYNQKHMTPELDREFGELARERIRRHRLRYYVVLPLVRIADLWLRPRTEVLPLDTRWWEFSEDLHDSLISSAMGLIGIFYVAAALFGMRRIRRPRYAGLLLSFIVLRSLFLGSMPNPEPRYTLECFPPLLVLAACGLRRPNLSRESPPAERGLADERRSVELQ